MNFFLRTPFAASCGFCMVVFSFSFASRYFKISPLISSLKSVRFFGFKFLLEYNCFTMLTRKFFSRMCSLL